MGLIKGGSFYMQVKGTWGNGVNPTKVGALFNPNDDADGDRAVFINKYWYKQLFWDKKIEVRVGVLQSNKDLFDVSPYAYHEDKDFLNLLSLRTPSVPHQTGIGAFLKLQPVDWLYFQAAAIDAEAGPRYEQNACSTAFHGRALYVGYWELGLRPKWQTPRGPMPGKYYVGWWYDSRAKEIFKDDLDGRRQPNFESGDVGSYLSFNQMVFKEKPDPEDVQGLGFFSRAGFAHRNVNRVARSWQVGLSYTGLCPTREKDVTAFSVAQGILSNRYRVQIHHAADRETVYELYHQFQVTPWCWITPDLQVITNPGGDKTDRDALVGGVRVRISF